MHALYSDYASKYNNMGFQTVTCYFRTTIMENDPIIASTLDIYADECTAK